ncbi:MAG: ATPase, partial [Clostridiales bacterium]|nr:ATPase [Clostridiales bacterium]
MIEKMKFLSITGPREDFDRVIKVYLNKYELHLENALTELSSVRDLKPFVETNPYKDVLIKSDELLKELNNSNPVPTDDITPDEASAIISKAFTTIGSLTEQKRKLKEERNHLNDLLEQIEPFRHLDYDLNKLSDSNFINFRYGRISNEYYNKFTKYVYETLTTVFYECDKDREYVWGVYFVPEAHTVKIDAIYSSLHFERIYLPQEYQGTPEEAYESITARKNDIILELSGIYDQIKEKLASMSDEILLSNETLKIFSKNHEVRKLAALTKGSEEDQFFILCGWMTEENSKNFIDEIEDDDRVFCLYDDSYAGTNTKTPTKLKNNRLFKPFEMFIKMYGLPDYNEIDPTSFVAITYSLIFGIMFGDVGQGLCLVIGGALIYKFKKVALAAVISTAGIFSTLFGFMYGSVFGFEDIIPHLWLNPMENVMTVLITAVAFGVILILIAMIMNVINGIKARDIKEIFFDTNSIAGLVFYGAAIACVALIFTKQALPATIVLIIFFAIPLLIMFFKEPLTHLIEKK